MPQNEIDNQRNIWSKIMDSKDDSFQSHLNLASNSSFEGIRIANLKTLMRVSPFSETTADPRDILCFVEKCVDERFVYTRQIPAIALKDPLVKYNYRQQVVDFGIPGVGCLYSPKESDLICTKISKFLQKNQIPVFVSEAHEGCGAVSAKVNSVFSFEGIPATPEMISDIATENAKTTAGSVKKISSKMGYKVKTYSKFATMESSCFRVGDGLNEQIARIHNGSGIIFLPNFLDKEANSRVFLPDKFCLANRVCMFNMIDTGSQLDQSPNSTSAYIVFCIKIMLGNHGLGREYFKHHPLNIIAACDNSQAIDDLRAYQVIMQVKALLEKDPKTKDFLDIFEYTILGF